MPVPGCSSFTLPTAEALAAYAQPDLATVSPYHRHWRLNHETNAMARGLAVQAGVWFVDVAEPSLQRPDAARGFDGNNQTVEDCLHCA